MREHTIARGLAPSSVSGGLTCDLYHALRLKNGEIEHWPYSGVKGTAAGAHHLWTEKMLRRRAEAMARSKE